MGFREEYEKFGKPSPEREAFVLKTLLSLPKDQIVKSMKPITVDGPNGTKITYKVMPDYIMLDGMRVPMAGNTAQQVADHFGLNLPTPKMVNDIYHNADVKIDAEPLSGSGAKINGKYYSPEEVVKQYGVGYAPFAVAYNDKVNQQLKEKGIDPNADDKIVAGFAKDIVPPQSPDKLGLYGLWTKEKGDKPVQPAGSPHDTNIHTEYLSFVRLVSPDVTITYPDGKTEQKPLGDVYQYARYNTPGSNPKVQVKPQTPPTSSPTPSKYQSDPALNPIDDLLQEFNVAAKTRMRLLMRVAKFSGLKRP